MTASTRASQPRNHAAVAGEPHAVKAARVVRPGGRWKRTRYRGHLASGLPEPSFSLYGAYEQLDEDYPAPACGHPEDRRTDLLQLHAALPAPTHPPPPPYPPPPPPP